MKDKFKDTYFLSHFIILVATFLLLTISMFFNMLKVSNTIFSSQMTYVPQWTYQMQTTYQYQCNTIWTMNGSQMVCNYVPVTNYVPVMVYAPQWNYYTTVFTSDVHLYDIILSCFHGNVAKIICISLLLLALLSCSYLIHSKKNSLRQVGLISYNVLTVILTGATIGVFRLLVNNFNSTSTGPSFYLVILVTIALIGFGVYSFVKFNMQKVNQENRMNVILRFVAFILLLLISETTITNLYGFIFMILLVVGIIISTKPSLKFKIIGTVFSSGVFLYSFITMIIALAQGLNKTSFFKIIPFDSLLFRFFSLGIFIIMLYLFFIEKKEIEKAKA